MSEDLIEYQDDVFYKINCLQKILIMIGSHLGNIQDRLEKYTADELSEFSVALSVFSNDASDFNEFMNLEGYLHD